MSNNKKEELPINELFTKGLIENYNHKGKAEFNYKCSECGNNVKKAILIVNTEHDSPTNDLLSFNTSPKFLCVLCMRKWLGFK
jgi:hypothetical protein